MDSLRAIARDPDAPVTAIAAAKWLLRCGSSRRTRSGTPIAGPELDRLLDRTIGKPTQAVQVRVEAGAREQALQAQLDAQLAAARAIAAGSDDPIPLLPQASGGAAGT
jgi:hypothetical protein